MGRPVSFHGAHEQGATLVVGLMLLLVVTVVGVSGMNTATMEVQMAANAQFQQDAFQMAEDGIEAVLATRNYSIGSERTIDWIGADLDRRAVTSYRSSTGVPHAAFSDEYRAFHFDIHSTGRGPRNAQSEHVQSFYVIGPAP